jgi:hypothetical protein
MAAMTLLVFEIDKKNENVIFFTKTSITVIYKFYYFDSRHENLAVGV